MWSGILVVIALVLFRLPLVAALGRLPPACVSEFQTLNKCLDENDECSSCIIIGPIDVNQSQGFCDAVKDSICQAFGCCPACESTFDTYTACMADLVWRVTLQNCDVECEGTPTSSPTAVDAVQDMFDEELDSQGCMEKFEAFANCTAKNSRQCDRCFASVVQDNPRESGFCTALTDAICSFGTCCEPCQSEFVDFDACFEVIAEEVTFGHCIIDCDAGRRKEPLDKSCVDRLRNFSQCLMSNPVECGTCASLTLPHDPHEIGFCNAATDALCGFSTCCARCDVAFQDFDECFEDWVATATNGKCLMNCDTIERSDSRFTPSGCMDSLQAYSTCILDNRMTCDTHCTIRNLPHPIEIGFCQAAADSICGLRSCCDACTREFNALDKCITTLASTETLGTCKIDCSASSPEEFFGYRHRGLRRA